MLKEEILLFALLTLVTAKRGKKNRPRIVDEQGGEVVSDGREIMLNG